MQNNELKIKLSADPYDLQSAMQAAEKSVAEFAQKAEASAKKVSKELDNLGKGGSNGLSGFLSKIGQVGLGIGTIFTAVNSAAEAVKPMIDAANSITGSTENLNDSLGENAEIITDWAKNNALSFNMSEKAALSAGASFSRMFQGFSANGEETATRTVDMLQTVSTIASRMPDMSTDVIIEKIVSGMRGETEAIEDLGIEVTEVAIKTTNAFKTMSNGAKNMADLSPEMQKQIRYFAILEQAAAKYGDTPLDGITSELKRNQAEFENLQSSLGAELAPAMAEVQKALLEVANAFLPVAKTLLSVVADILSGFANMNGLDAFILGLGALSVAMFNFNKLATGFLSIVSNLKSGFTAAVAAVKALAAGMTTLQFSMGVVGVALAAVALAFATLQSQVKETQAAIESMQETAKQNISLQISTNLKDQRAEIHKKIQEKYGGTNDTNIKVDEKAIKKAAKKAADAEIKAIKEEQDRVKNAIKKAYDEKINALQELYDADIKKTQRQWDRDDLAEQYEEEKAALIAEAAAAEKTANSVEEIGEAAKNSGTSLDKLNIVAQSPIDEGTKENTENTKSLEEQLEDLDKEYQKNIKSLEKAEYREDLLEKKSKELEAATESLKLEQEKEIETAEQLYKWDEKIEAINESLQESLSNTSAGVNSVSSSMQAAADETKKFDEALGFLEKQIDTLYRDAPQKLRELTQAMLTFQEDGSKAIQYWQGFSTEEKREYLSNNGLASEAKNASAQELDNLYYYQIEPTAGKYIDARNNLEKYKNKLENPDIERLFDISVSGLISNGKKADGTKYSPTEAYQKAMELKDTIIKNNVTITMDTGEILQIYKDELKKAGIVTGGF